jgi:ATP-dependent Zn protease
MRGGDGGVREQLAAGIMAKQFPAGTAYHEAGHAVVGYALGLRVRGSNIRKPRETK